MSKHLKKCERERRLEKIRGRARAATKNGGSRVKPLTADERALLNLVVQEDLLKVHDAALARARRLYAKGLVRFVRSQFGGTPRKELWADVEATAAGVAEAKKGSRGASAVGSADDDPDQHNTPHNLELYAMNTSELYDARQDTTRGLLRKLKAGTYDRAESVRRWESWLNKAGRRYAQEFHTGPGKHGAGPFTRDVVKRAAEGMADWFEATARGGEHDHLLG